MQLTVSVPWKSEKASNECKIKKKLLSNQVPSAAAAQNEKFHMKLTLPAGFPAQPRGGMCKK